MGRHFSGNLLRNRALIERLGALLADQAQRLRQVFLHQLLTRLQRHAVFPEDGLRGGPAAHGFLFLAQCLGQCRADGVAFFRQRNRRSHDRGQRHGAPARERMRHACHGTRHAYGVMGE